MAKQVEILEIRFDTDQASKNAVQLKDNIDNLRLAQKVLEVQGKSNTLEYQKNSEALKLNRTQLQQTNKTINDNKLAMKAATGSIEEQRKRLSVLNDQWKRQGTATKEGRARQAALAKEVGKLTAELKKQETAVGNHTRNVGNYTNSINQSAAVLGGKMAPGLMASTSGFAAMTKAALAFIATPIGAIIAAIGVALGAVITYLKRTQEGIDLMERAWTAVTTTIDVLIDRLANIGESLIMIVQGDFVGGLNGIKDAFSGIADEVEREVKAMDELIQLQQQLTIAQNNFIVGGARLKRQYQELRAAAEDRSKTEAERIDLLRQANDVQRQLADIQQDFITKEVQIAAGLKSEAEALELINKTREDANYLTREMIGLAISNEEDRKELLTLIAQFDEVDAESTKKQITNITKIESIKIQQQKNIDAAEAELHALRLARDEENAEIQELREMLEGESLDRQLERRREVARETIELDEDVLQATLDNLDTATKARKEASQNAIKFFTTTANNINELTAEGTALNKAAGITNATVNTYVGATKALAEIPPPLSYVAMATTIATGLLQVSKILTAKAGDMWTFGNGGKSGVFGGKSHAAGGTKGTFSDGTRVEVEKDEAFIVVNKKDTPLLEQLNSINSIHGKPFMRDGGSLFMQDGGIANRQISAPVTSGIQQVNQMKQILRDMPNPIVYVDDIRSGVGNQVSVEQLASG